MVRQLGFHIFALLLAACVPQAFAHGEEHQDIPAPEMGMAHGHAHSGMDRPMVMKDMEDFPDLPTYFSHGEHSGMVFAHIGLMVLAWVVVLPLAVMLSIGRSRLTLPSQLLFLLVNACGLATGIFYNTSTPDLYENNSHHKLGWAMTWIAVAWAILGLINLYTRTGASAVRPPLQPVSHQAMAEYQRLNAGRSMDNYRWSHDSGQGTERNTESLCNSSRSNSWNSESSDLPTSKKVQEADEELQDEEKAGLLQNTSVDRFLTRSLKRFASSRISRIISIFHVVLERGMIPLSFLALMTGLVTYSGIGKGRHVFNILAHLIKGGIFFWYGLLTFGRWMGCFSDLGWAWNLKPEAETVGRAKARLPSAEFTESFVIFLYGASNVFLEHLGAWGKEWSPMDFEHVSITIMFFGGGLLGMLIESRRVRNFLSGAINCTPEFQQGLAPEWQTPKSYSHPLNPIPSLVILLLGIMMSNHTQHSLISGQIHKQWGLLFAGFAISRALTYVTFWLKPPETYLPTRPPTEILAAFCLVSGGAIFMASNKDTINALEEYDLDSMFVFTVMMGFTCLIMAWTLLTVAVKGWAVRGSQRRAPNMTATLA